MAVTNTLACYDRATIKAIKGFMAQTPDVVFANIKFNETYELAK